MAKEPCTFLGKGGKGKGLFDVYINGKVTENKTREEADKLLAEAKGSPVAKTKSAIAKEGEQ